MNAGFTGYSDLAMHLTVDADQEPTEIGQRTIISFQDTESKTFQDALDNMKQSLYVPMIQIITSIPDGYLQLLMNGIGDGQ